MSVISGVSDFFGLDIGTTAIRLVQLNGSGPVKSLSRYAYSPIDSKIVMSDSKADMQKVAEVITKLVSQSGVSTRNVAVGLPSSRVFTTVVDMDRMSPGELAQSMEFQADSLIPTPIAESKIDWAIIGDSPKEQTKIEVLLTSASNDYIEGKLDMLESIGLNVIAFEPDNLALSRALVAPEASSSAPQLVLDIGSMSTDLVIVYNGSPRLTRAIPTGTEAILKAATQNLNIDQKQAEQFVFKFGLVKDKLEGQVFQAIIGTVELLITDIEKSIKFFEQRYQGMKIGNIIVTGGASALPEFPLYVANKFGVNVEIGNAWRNVSYSQDKQNDLIAISNHFGVAAGLAERVE
jgi:type IV pilus assembly protein PilM